MAFCKCNHDLALHIIRTPKNGQQKDECLVIGCKCTKMKTTQNHSGLCRTCKHGIEDHEEVEGRYRGKCLMCKGPVCALFEPRWVDNPPPDRDTIERELDIVLHRHNTPA